MLSFFEGALYEDQLVHNWLTIVVTLYLKIRCTIISFDVKYHFIFI